MIETGLKTQIDELWEELREVTDARSRIGQISLLLFMNIVEDWDNDRKQMAILREEEYTSIFEGTLEYNGHTIEKEECRRSVWNQYQAEEMRTHILESVIPFLSYMNDHVFQMFMKNNSLMVTDPRTLTRAVTLVTQINLWKKDPEQRHAVYEYLLEKFGFYKENSQYPTPRHIINLQIALADPDVGEKICDTACGTGGYLAKSYLYIRKKYTSDEFINTEENGEEYGFKTDKLSSARQGELKTSTFFGVDIDDTMVHFALMNLLLLGITTPNITQVNSLSTRYEEFGSYDMVINNPPFNGKIEESEKSDRFSYDTNQNRFLFVDLMIYLLKTGGRCCTLVPEGFLFGSTNDNKAIRKKLIKECRLDAVISLPKKVFPSNTSAAIIFFIKGEPTEKVFFYKMEADGYSIDNKREFIDGKGDIPDILEKFGEFQNGEDFSDHKSKYFTVTAEEIEEKDWNLMFSEWQEIEYEEVEYDPPKVLLDKVIEFEESIINSANKLKEVDLMKKLMRHD